MIPIIKGLDIKILGTDYTISLNSGTEEEIRSSMERAIEDMDIDILYSGRQVHGTNVEYVPREGNPHIWGQIFEGTDGLYTDKPRVGLVIKYADCSPIIVYDPKNRTQGAVHSGWRGTRSKIAKVLIDKMREDFGSDPKDLLIYIGPTIDQKNYQVGRDVYNEFESWKRRDEFFRPDGEKFLMDMITPNMILLEDIGIKRENITIDSRSTYEDLSLHSARREGKDYGLNGIISVITER